MQIDQANPRLAVRLWVAALALALAAIPAAWLSRKAALVCGPVQSPEWFRSAMHGLGILLAPFAVSLVVVFAAAAWALSHRVARTRTRAALVLVATVASLVSAWAVAVAVGGGHWHARDMFQPAPVLILYLVPLLTTGSLLWRRTRSFSEALGVALVSCAGGTLLFMVVSELVGAPSN